MSILVYPLSPKSARSSCNAQVQVSAQHKTSNWNFPHEGKPKHWSQKYPSLLLEASALKSLFLDFDGVLHTLSEAHTTPFSRLHMLHRVIIGNPVHIIVSSSWRFHYSWREIKAHMGILAPNLIGTTGPAASGKFARHQEILEFAALHGISDDWRALDDAQFDFPEHEHRLVACDPKVGVQDAQIKILEAWVTGK